MGLRAALLALGVAIAGALIGVFITRFLTVTPPVITATTTSQSIDGRPVVDITLTTVGAVGSGDHPNWVAYLNSDGNPDTFMHVPAGAVVHMTIDQQDGASGLRNEFFGLVRGTLNASMDVQCAPSTAKQFGKKFCGTGEPAIDPADAAHTFTIPDIGVSVPLLAVADDAPSNAQNVVSFDFVVPDHPTLLRWQCFVPCGAGTLYGNGGPMQTLGYMAGELQVG